jgi:hypothetical protein
MSDRPECAFELLRYYFGGNRPSQTDRLTLSPAQFHGIKVRTAALKGWYLTGGSAQACA